ncbi:MAG TPA: NUDIX hydrolase [Steroidobacteraceae bacterium]|nr:NUDIX hydrolase [Steroidobacteraceae bacterium]
MIRRTALIATLLATGGCAALRPACELQPAYAFTDSASAACAILEQHRLLVIRHLYSGKLDLPGGMAKRGENARCTAQRETWEETGLRVTVLEPLPGLGNVYHCVLTEPQASVADPPLRWWSRGEVTDLRWVDPATLTAAEWRYGERVESLKHALSGIDDGGPPARPRD